MPLPGTCTERSQNKCGFPDTEYRGDDSLLLCGWRTSNFKMTLQLGLQLATLQA